MFSEIAEGNNCFLLYHQLHKRARSTKSFAVISYPSGQENDAILPAQDYQLYLTRKLSQKAIIKSFINQACLAFQYMFCFISKGQIISKITNIGKFIILCTDMFPQKKHIFLCFNGSSSKKTRNEKSNLLELNLSHESVYYLFTLFVQHMSSSNYQNPLRPAIEGNEQFNCLTLQGRYEKDIFPQAQFSGRESESVFSPLRFLLCNF